MIFNLFKKKEVKVNKPKKEITELAIYFTTGTNSWISFTADVNGGKWLEPWDKFYKWFTEEKDKETFSFRHNTGETTLIRQHIQRFSIIIKEVE